VVTRRQVLELVEAGLSYDDVAARLGVRPGLAYLVATGLPADGSETTLTDEDRARPGYLRASTQHLANPAPVLEPSHHDVVHEWIATRVRGDTAMQRAAAASDGARAPRDPDDDRDIITVLGRDHNAVHSLTNKFKTTPGSTQGGAPDQIERRASLVARIRDALHEHLAAEDEHLWPAVEALVPDGARLASRGRAQEQQATATLAALAAVDPRDARYDELVEQLEHEIRAHVAFEDRVFLALRDVTTDDQRQQLGARIRAAEIVESATENQHNDDTA
jgi:hypothetical protein